MEGKLLSTQHLIIAILKRYISIGLGKDADLVIWDQHPLTLGARPKHVIIDGMELAFNTSWAKHVDEEIQETLSNNQHVQEASSNHVLPPRPATSMHVHDTSACTSDVDTFVLRNISRLYAGPEQTYDGPIELAVKQGRVACIGSNCSKDENTAEFDLNGGVVIPVSHPTIACTSIILISFS